MGLLNGILLAAICLMFVVAVMAALVGEDGPRRHPTVRANRSHRYHKRRARFLEDSDVRAGYEDDEDMRAMKEMNETMSDYFSKDKWSMNPFCIDPMAYKYSTDDLVKRAMEQTKTKTVYRIKREDGSVVPVQEGGVGGSITLDLFGIYAPGRYETEEAAHKAAVEYCEKQYKQLQQAAQTHRAWLIRYGAQTQRLAIGDRVVYCGTESFATRVRGLVKPVTAARKSKERGFEYLVDFPRLDTVWIPQADLMLRERGRTPGTKRPEPVRTSVDLLGLKARVKKEGGSFRTIEKVTFAADGSGARFQLQGGCLYWKRDELEVEGIDIVVLDEN